MTIGTKSVLYGAHCFFIHPWFVALAWSQLYGFPWHPCLWLAFFVHDLGYIGKPNMDGPEGETHPEVGASIMRMLTWRKDVMEYMYVDILDLNSPSLDLNWRIGGATDGIVTLFRWRSYWEDFCLFHSRHYAKKLGHPPSRLCFADKLAFALTPRWLYLPMVRATGELAEYLHNAQRTGSAHWKPTGYDAKRWHAALCIYMRDWVAVHKNGSSDTWISADRHARNTSGATQ